MNFDTFETVRKNGLVCVIDWFSFTDVMHSDVRVSVSQFGFSFNEFYEADKGASGYKRMLLHRGSTLRVLFDGKDNMGIHYDFSGSSIKELYSHVKELLNDSSESSESLDARVLSEVFNRVKSVGHVTRLDLAIDDKDTPYFSMLELQEVLEQERFVSKFRSWQLVKDCTTTNVLTGCTIYLGSRRSDIMLRIYDKQLERIAKGIEGAEDVAWIRWELELKNEYANIALTDLINGVDVGSLVFGILNNYLRIILLDFVNKSRCSMDPKWEAFIVEVSKIRLFVTQEPATLSDKREWVLRQVAPTITGLVLSEYGDISWLFENFGSNAMRMSRHLKKLVSQVNPDWFDMLQDFDN